MQLRHFTAVALSAMMAPAILLDAVGGPIAPAQAPSAVQSPAAQPAEGDVEFTLFLSGARVGIERVRLARSGTTWVLSSTAQFGAPINTTVNRFEVKYTADWQPLELHIEATQAGQPMSLATSFSLTTAINEITQKGTTTSRRIKSRRERSSCPTPSSQDMKRWPRG
jgi:hypothetical protein